MDFIMNIIMTIFLLGVLGYCIMCLWAVMQPDKESGGPLKYEGPIVAIFAVAFIIAIISYFLSFIDR